MGSHSCMARKPGGGATVMAYHSGFCAQSVFRERSRSPGSANAGSSRPDALSVGAAGASLVGAPAGAGPGSVGPAHPNVQATQQRAASWRTDLPPRGCGGKGAANGRHVRLDVATTVRGWGATNRGGLARPGRGAIHGNAPCWARHREQNVAARPPGPRRLRRRKTHASAARRQLQTPGAMRVNHRLDGRAGQGTVRARAEGPPCGR